MRLNRFDLTRFGKFTDLRLDFPAPRAGAPDLHVIYGANEAGKSTLLEAWLDLLFEIPTQSPMDFLHPYASMQIGAALEIDGQTHDVIRVKKRIHSLLDSANAPMGEALLHAGLRGIDRSAYSAMFSLNRHTLEKGGESILASKGDLGQLLFQASAGLTDLASQLDTLRAKSEDFLSKSGRKGRLRDLGATFAELNGRIRQLDTAAAEYARLSRERDKAHTSWQKARETAEKTQAEVIATGRLSEALPLAGRLTGLDKRIAEFGDLPEPPAGWLDELPQLDREETAIATQLETAEKIATELADELDQLPADQAILDISDAIGSAETMKSAYDTAVEDLPRRLKERDGVSSAIGASLARLGQADAEASDIMPESAVLGRLQGLVERHSGIETACRTALREFEVANAGLENAARRLREAGGGAADLGGLGGLVQSLRRDDPAGMRDRARSHLAEAEADLQTALSSLAPWSGDAATLAGLAAPDPGALDHLIGEMTAANRAAAIASERLAQLEQDADQARIRRDAIGTAATATLEEAAAIRARRESEWARHRTDLSTETADTFEAAMRLDDRVTATLSDQRAQAEKSAEAARVWAETEGQVQIARTKAADGQALCDRLAERLAGMVRAVSPDLPADMEGPGFLSWLAQLDMAKKSLAMRDKTARDLAHLQGGLEAARANVLGALAQVGREMPGDTSFPLALETAQSLLDRAAQISERREAEAAARGELAGRDKDLRLAEAARTAWRTAWNAACSETWMADDPPGVDEMGAILKELEQLRPHQARFLDLGHRIATMEANRDRFEAAVRALSRQLGMTTDVPAPLQWCDLAARLRAAEGQEKRRNDLKDRIARARKDLQATEDRSRVHQSRTAEFARHFGASTWVEARETLARAGDLARLRANRRDMAADLCSRMHCATVEESLARLDALDSDALSARVSMLQADLAILRTQQEEAHTAFRDAEKAVEAVGGDDAVARLEEQRQTLLLEMQEGAQRHLRQRLGLLAVDAALRRYRDTHRSGMLERASDAFRLMSRDRYSGLSAQPDGTREILVALAAEGGSRQADQLSDGTRAQLYLALRIAGYQEFVRNNGPVPFIADDIMESFDDNRTAEAFRLLSKMSETGQVIYLTHHAHLCEIARNACPAVQVHELPD